MVATGQRAIRIDFCRHANGRGGAGLELEFSCQSPFTGSVVLTKG